MSDISIMSGWTGTRFGKPEGDEPLSTSAPKPSPRRRDSRQISDVLTAYAQGINRSTSRRERSVAADSTRSANDDDTQRST
jgi:hypothetical protein